jgi:hypothetical protein
VNKWSWFWLIWFSVSILTFLVAEVWALCTDWHNTLSENVWKLESFRTGQDVFHWTAGHTLFAGVWILMTVWLTGHFLFHIWA